MHQPKIWGQFQLFVSRVNSTSAIAIFAINIHIFYILGNVLHAYGLSALMGELLALNEWS